MSERNPFEQEIDAMLEELSEEVGRMEFGNQETEDAEYHFRKFMESIGLNPNDSEHLEDTPGRVTRAYRDDLFSGLNKEPEDVLTTTFTEGVSDDMVIVDNIQVKSTCSHHWLPFRGKAHVGYIPDEEIVGLSKIPRLVNVFARRPQVQERLTSQIADALYEHLDPIAVVVVVECEHQCMSLRGVEEPESVTRTSALRGAAEEKEDIKQEFMELASLEG